jgi:hypothetical protein
MKIKITGEEMIREDLQQAENCVDQLQRENAQLRKEREILHEALRQSRASFLGLMPDEPCPMSRQMGKAVERIQIALEQTGLLAKLEEGK